MSDLLRTASDWLETQRTAYRTQTVTYRRGDLEVEVAATVGRTVFDALDEYGAVERVETRDFLVLAEALVLAGTLVRPQAGDRIVETQGGRSYLYGVMGPGGEPPWRWSDPYRKTLRIHSRQIWVEET